MNVEILKVANGYLVKPVDVYHQRGEGMLMERMWVFRTYQQLCDSLQEILEAPERK